MYSVTSNDAPNGHVYFIGTYKECVRWTKEHEGQWCIGLSDSPLDYFFGK